MSRQWKTITVDGKKYEVRDIDLDEEVVLDAKGERITEARAEQLADETMREVYRRRGQPSLSGEHAPSPRLSFRVPPAVARRAEEVAADEGMSLSQLGREALQQYLERREERGEPTKH
jgi:predicted HicB family RNase H-like nuclease